MNFWRDAKVTPASQFITVDLALLFLAAVILMVVEARKHNVKFVWAYIVGGFLLAGSVTFPLFLIARELRLGRSEEPHLRTTDTILLAVLAVAAAGLTTWIDVG